ISAVAVGVAIRLLGARDWRWYGAVILTFPVFGALELGAIAPLLLLLVAAGWRYRDRAAGGVLLALAAAVKLFLWPVLVWLVVSLFATPLLWMHYLVLLIVPLLLFSPSLSVSWLVLVLLWATPRYASAGELWRLLLTLTVVAVVASAPRLLWRKQAEAEQTVEL